MSKKIYLLGIKKEEEGDNEVKLKEEEIEEKMKEINADYEYFELNADNSVAISKAITDIFTYCAANSLKDNNDKMDTDGHSCKIY